MKRRPRFDIEITFEPGYSLEGRPYRPYVARLYQHGARIMAWIIETGESDAAALSAALENVRRWDGTPDTPKYPRTVTVDEHGEIIQ